MHIHLFFLAYSGKGELGNQDEADYSVLAQLLHCLASYSWCRIKPSPSSDSNNHSLVLLLRFAKPGGVGFNPVMGVGGWQVSRIARPALKQNQVKFIQISYSVYLFHAVTVLGVTYRDPPHTVYHSFLRA